MTAGGNIFYEFLVGGKGCVGSSVPHGTPLFDGHKGVFCASILFLLNFLECALLVLKGSFTIKFYVFHLHNCHNS